MMNQSCLYRSTDNRLFLRLPTKYYHFVCFRLSTYLYALFMCLYRQEIHSPGNMNKSQLYGHLHGLHFIVNLNFSCTLYDRKMCLLSLHQAYGSGEINKQTHSWKS